MVVAGWWDIFLGSKRIAQFPAKGGRHLYIFRANAALRCFQGEAGEPAESFQDGKGDVET